MIKNLNTPYFADPRDTQTIPELYTQKSLRDPNNRKYVIHLNSDYFFADSYNSLPSSFNVTLTAPIIAKEDELIYISCSNVTVPYSFYGVSYLNNTINIIESDEDGSNAQPQIQIILPDGNYDYALLLAELETQLNAKTNHHIVYVVAYNSGTNKFTISTSTADKRAVFDFNLENSPYKQYGFDLKSYTMTTNLPITSDQVVEACSIYNLFIRLLNINLDRSYDTLIKTTTNILCTIPVNAPPLGIIYSTDYNYFETPLRQQMLRDISISLTDEWGRQIDLNGKSYSLDLIVNLVKKV